jgi:hypothetical protein
MPVCPKCGVSFSYTETHLCEGRDKTKMWWLASVAIGALAGGPLGLLYGKSVVVQVCGKPDAGNLCGLMSAPAVAFYITIGAAIGASVAALAVLVILRTRPRIIPSNDGDSHEGVPARDPARDPPTGLGHIA